MTKHSEQRFTLHITGPDTDQSIEIATDVFVVGRKSGVDFQLSNDMVSREHAKIEKMDAACAVTDLNSSNGTKVNGTWLSPGQPRQLVDGDIIEIEPFRLVLVVTAVLQETPSETIEASEPVEHEVPAAAQPEPEPAPAPVRPAAQKKADPVAAAKPKKPKAISAPPPPPPQNGHLSVSDSMPAYTPPPGLSYSHSHYLQFLPDIYHTAFMARFLALFESIYRPIEWTVDNFDQFLHPQTAPEGFLPWLADWFDLLLDDSWRAPQKRQLLSEAYQLYAQRGTKTAISRILEIYTEQTPEIDDLSDTLAPFTFVVRLPSNVRNKEAQIEALLNVHKPAYTNYALQFE